MPQYTYIVTSEITVDAPNIMAAEKAVHGTRGGRWPAIQLLANQFRSVRLPSQRVDSPVWVRVTGGPLVIHRKKP